MQERTSNLPSSKAFHAKTDVREQLIKAVEGVVHNGGAENAGYYLWLTLDPLPGYKDLDGRVSELSMLRNVYIGSNISQA